MRHGTQCRRVLQGFLAAAAIVAMFGSGSASAQWFEWAYGSPNCVDGGLHGVKQLAGGGYVAVGESFQNAAGGCGGSNPYVVVTNAAGGPVWANTYPIGTNGRATDVLELINGDLIVCGYSTIGPPCHAGVSNDIFVLHLNAGGGVIAANTYGGSTTTEEAWKIIQTTVGDMINTFPGDYVIAGSSTNQNAPGQRGGYLLRINAALALIWDRQYGTSNNDDYFYGVDEVPTQFPGAGDIVACGGSNSPPATGLDVFVVRVNGNTSNIGLPPQNQSWTSFAPAGGVSNEEGRSVIVVRNGPSAGDIVVTGYTNGAPAPSTNDEVFALELGQDPCIQVANVYFGDNGRLPDRGYDLVEDANPTVGAGDVVITGFTNIPGGFGASDVFLQRVSLGPGMALAGPGGDYGGNGPDEGWSVGNATRNVPGSETPGYIVNGMTRSASLIGAADPQQLYLIKTDLGLNTFCHDRHIQFPNARAPKGTQCGTALGPNIGLFCNQQVFPMPLQNNMPLCNNIPPTKPGVGNANEGVQNEATIAFNEGRMTSYPNPLRSGDVLNLRFELSSSATAHVAVTDIAGRETYRSDAAITKGTQLVPVNTEHWPAGTYLVRVTIGSVSATSHIVVLDK